MQFKVVLMRKRGRRLSWVDISNAPHFVGAIRSHEAELDRFRLHAVALFDLANPDGTSLLPLLYDPVMTGFATNAFGLRGFEMIDGPTGPAMIQEWYCIPP